MTAPEHQSTLENAISFGTRSTFAASFALDPDIQSKAAYLCAYDSLFGPVLVIIYCDESTNSYSAAFISAHGENVYNNITLSSKSAYYGAVKNLPSRFKDNDYAKAAAISALRTFACMPASVRAVLISAAEKAHGIADWDETNAGELAGSLTLICGKSTRDLSRYVLDNGLLQPHSFSVLTLDVVFKDSDETIELNNELVYSLGQRLENLFDPSAQYCPEPTEELYTPPDQDSQQTDDGPESVLIIKELVELQNRYTIALHDFVSEFLSPLRVLCLENSKEDTNTERISISLINEIFPPTVDEVMRINKLYLSALKSAAPFGALETLRASALTIPYFFKACMRHQSAMGDFVHQIRANYDKILSALPDWDRDFYSIRYLEQLLMVGQHLAKVKVILLRLLKASNSLNEEQSSLARQYISTCVDTIDAFANSSTNVGKRFRHNRVITPSGKLLTEFTAGWPLPLRGGWSYRRIISINSAFLLSTDPTERQEHILVIFSDYFLILKPRIPNQKATRPSIADRLMYSLSNETFIKDIPNLDIVGFADVVDVVASEYGIGNQNLSLFFSGEGFMTNSPAKSVTMRKLNYQMDPSSGTRASQMVEYFVKSRIVKKTHAFHLFRWKHKAIELYATVQEINAYQDDQTRTPVAIFLNTEISANDLDLYGIDGAIKVTSLDDAKLSLETISHFGIDGSKIISRENFNDEIFALVSEMVVACSGTGNSKEVHHIIGANEAILSNVIRYGMEASPKRAVEHQGPLKKAIKASAEGRGSISKSKGESTTLFARRSSTASSFLHRLLSTKSSGFRKNRDSQLFQQVEISKVKSARSSLESNKRKERPGIGERRKSEESILSFKRNSHYNTLKAKPSTILEQETDFDGKRNSPLIDQQPLVPSILYEENNKSIRQVSDNDHDSNGTPGLEESNNTSSPTIRQLSSSISDDINNSLPVSSETRHFNDVLNHPIIKHEEENETNTELMLDAEMEIQGATDGLGITVEDDEKYNKVPHDLMEMPSSPILSPRVESNQDDDVDTREDIKSIGDTCIEKDTICDEEEEVGQPSSQIESKDLSFAYLADYLNGRVSLECDKDTHGQYVVSKASITNTRLHTRVPPPTRMPYDRSVGTLYLRDESYGYLAPYIDGSPDDTEHEFYSATATPVISGEEQLKSNEDDQVVKEDESNWSEMSHSETVSIASQESDDVFEDASSFVLNEEIPPQRPGRSLSEIPSSYRISLRQLSGDIPFAESMISDGRNWLIDEKLKDNGDDDDAKVTRTRSSLCEKSYSDNNSINQPTTSRSLGQLSDVDLSRPSALSALVENASSSSLKSTMMQDNRPRISTSPLKHSQVAQKQQDDDDDDVRGLADRALHFFDGDGDGDDSDHQQVNSKEQSTSISDDESCILVDSTSLSSMASSLISNGESQQGNNKNYKSENVSALGSSMVLNASDTKEPENSVTQDGIVIKRPNYPTNSIRAVSGGALKVTAATTTTATRTNDKSILKRQESESESERLQVSKIRDNNNTKKKLSHKGIERKPSNPFKGVSKFFSKIKNDLQKI